MVCWCVGVLVCLHAACCVVLHADTDVTTLLLPFSPPLGTGLVWRIGGTRRGGSQGSTGTPPSHTRRSIPGYRGHRRLGEGEGGRRRKEEEGRGRKREEESRESSLRVSSSVRRKKETIPTMQRSV